MNVIRIDNPAPPRGRSKGRGKWRGKCADQVTNVLPKYQFNSGIARPLVNLCPTDTTGNLRTQFNKNRRGRGTCPSLFRSTSIRSGSNTEIKSTTGSSLMETCIILAITAGRGDARGEVGMAAVDVRRPYLVLCQMSDYQTYINTLTKIFFFDPVEVLMPDTMCHQGKRINKLYSSIREKFPKLNITPVSRIHFNESVGMDRVKTHCAKEYSTVELFVKQKYYALAAAAALLKYVEFIQHIVYAPKSMKIEFQGSPNTTIIDVESAESLELVASQSNQSNICLLGAMDHCTTPMGRRLLRASILQPPCDERIIMQRQQCVNELVSNRSLHGIIQPVIRRLYGADRLLSLSMMNSESNIVQNAERNLNYVLLLKHSLDIIPELRGVLHNGVSSFFEKVCQNLQNPQFPIMQKKVLELIHPDARSLIGYTSSNMQRCFAIKAGINDLLDVARKTYCELIDNMKNMVENLAIKHKLNLSLECNSSLGFHIIAELPRRLNLKIHEFPAEFVQVRKNRNVFSMTTNKLLVLSQQCIIACEELHLMSNMLLNDLLIKLREHIGSLYQLSTDVAELDLILSLAQVSSTPEYVCPTFGTKLELKESLHPIMEVFGNERPIPNDVYASVPYNYHTIIGPNMSGKSIYLKQIVLLHIMAQIGCYVPARKAEFRITDRIFCRICFRDDIECNASTFVVEMKEAQYILQSITSKSLVILDELCRGTTAEEGCSITWAISEQLLITTAFTFSATHFLYLTCLADLYYNVTNHCFETETKLIAGSNETRLIYTHKLIIGLAPVDNYGIALAEISGLPKSVIIKAREYAANEALFVKAVNQCTVSEKSFEKICYDRVSEMYKLLENNRFSRRNIIGIIHDLDVKSTDEPKSVPQGMEFSDFCKSSQSFKSTQAHDRNVNNTKTSSSSLEKVHMSQKCKYACKEIKDDLNVSQLPHEENKCVDMIDINTEEKHETEYTESSNMTDVKHQTSKYFQNVDISPLKTNEAKRRLEDLMNAVATEALLKPDESDITSTENEIDRYNSKTGTRSITREKQSTFALVADIDNTNALSEKVLSDFNETDSIMNMVTPPSFTLTSESTLILTPKLSQMSRLYEHCLSGEYFKPSYSRISTLSDIAKMNARKKEAEIFRQIEGSAFDEAEFLNSTKQSVIIDLTKN